MPEMKAELRLMQPHGLAQLIEDRNTIVEGVKELVGLRVGRVITAQSGKINEGFKHGPWQ